MAKLISTLGLIAAVATAIAAQVDAISPRAGAWVLLAAGVAAAAGGALTKFFDAPRGAVFLGLVVAVTGALAMSQGLFSARLMAVVSILGTGAAAAGKSLFGWADEPEEVIGSKVTGVFLSLLLAVLPTSGCGAKTARHKLAVYTAQADAGLVALTDATATLHAAGRTSAQNAKNIYVITLRAVSAVEVVRERARTGFDRRDTLTVLDALLDDIRKAEAAGVIGLGERDKQKFLEITFFAQFTVRSIRAVVEAVREPDVPKGEVVAAARPGRSEGASVWTDLVLILQNAVLRGISQSRMTMEEAFADGAALSAQLNSDLAAKIAALP